MAAWPATGVIYSKIYWATGKFLFDYFKHFGIAEFSRSADGSEIYITAYNRQSMNNRGNMSEGKSVRKIRYGDYMYMAFLAALITATPVPFKRRGWGLVWGLFLMQATAVGKLAIAMIALLGLLGSEEVSVVILSPFWSSVVVVSYYVFVNNPTTSFVIAFFIWILVTFRRSDWERFAAARGTGR